MTGYGTGALSLTPDGVGALETGVSMAMPAVRTRGDLIGARDTGEALDAVITAGPGWEGLGDLVAKAAALASTAVSDPLNHVLGGYSRLRRYTPRMLCTLDIKASPAAEPLLEAVGVLRSNGTARPTGFLRPNSRWSRLLRTQPDHRLWETAVLFHLRDAFRAGDVWLARSRRYGDIRKTLLSAPAVAGVSKTACSASRGRKPPCRTGPLTWSPTSTGGCPRRGSPTSCSRWTTPPGSPRPSRTCEPGSPAATASVCSTCCPPRHQPRLAQDGRGHRLPGWHVEGDAFDRALAVVVEAQAALPMAAFWGTGRTASSDGEFFPAAGRGEALNLVNARYGAEPGVKAYSHVSDRFSPFATQTIPATAHEAPYILDGLLMNETGRRVREQYADTGGFTDHVFAACSILGYSFVPRIRDLPSKRLYVFVRTRGRPEAPAPAGRRQGERGPDRTGTGRTSSGWRPPWRPGRCGRASSYLRRLGQHREPLVGLDWCDGLVDAAVLAPRVVLHPRLLADAGQTLRRQVEQLSAQVTSLTGHYAALAETLRGPWR